MRLNTRHCLVAENMKITFGKCKLFSILFSDFLSDEMLNKPRNICNAESFSGISAKTIDDMVGNTRIYISQITINALLLLCYDYIRIFVKQIPTLAKGTTAFVSVSNTCLTARLEIAVFYVPLPTIENVEICWKRRKIGHYRAVQFSGREAVSISPKQSVVGLTPTGLITK